ncbi:unnamed protein product, partial [Scytosiphon promiscuus]
TLDTGHAFQRKASHKPNALTHANCVLERRIKGMGYHCSRRAVVLLPHDGIERQAIFD